MALEVLTKSGITLSTHLYLEPAPCCRPFSCMMLYLERRYSLTHAPIAGRADRYRGLPGARHLRRATCPARHLTPSSASCDLPRPSNHAENTTSGKTPCYLVGSPDPGSRCTVPVRWYGTGVRHNVFTLALEI